MTEIDDWKIKTLTLVKLWIYKPSDWTQSNPTSDEFKGMARKCLVEILSYFVLTASLIWVVISFKWDICDPRYEWFPRSGACLVASALLVELVAGFGPWRTPTYQATAFLTELRYIASVSGYILAVLGTIIWAYGDLIHSKLM